MEEGNKGLLLHSGHAGKKRKSLRVDRNDVKQYVLKL